MVSSRSNALSQALDIAGSLSVSSSLTLADEASGLGSRVSGQTGAAASITTVATGVATLTGLTGMTANSVGNFLTISGAASGGNNGTFLIVEYVGATSIKVANTSAVASDANNGAISWIERYPYSLQDDLNFARTDRAAIKGVAYSAAIPTYQRPSAVGTSVPANLSNIAGKTTDAMSLIVTKKFAGVSITATNTSATLTDTGNMKHADATDKRGIPTFDAGPDSASHENTYVEIINPATGEPVEVLSGGDAGKRVYGRTIATGATSPNSVVVAFRAVAIGAALSTSVSYAWEAAQPASVDMYYGWRYRLDEIDENALRTTMVNGLQGDADLRNDVDDLQAIIGSTDETTSLASLLTNTGNWYPFSDLPDGTPSVVEALNTLNSQIGDRSYTGSILVDGETVTASLQSLSNAIGSSTITRTIERLASQ
jgi:hypothetical protein